MQHDELKSAFASQSDAQAAKPTPIRCVRNLEELTAGLTPQQRAWVDANGFKAIPLSTLALPDDEGGFQRILFGMAGAERISPVGPPEHLIGRLPTLLPAGLYQLDPDGIDLFEAALAWGLGAYRFDQFKSAAQAGDRADPTRARLLLPDGLDGERIAAITAAVWQGRDLINRPANELGPLQLTAAIEALAGDHGADVKVWRGETPTFPDAFPLVHAVGKASTRPPQVIDLQWGDPNAPKVTLVGKGICFDTGGLDIKPPVGMRLMKKDMGGAAVSITLARMIMELGVPVRLRLIVTAAENAVAGNAFRPGDILKSRQGLTVEIGNTDAEGRLVLADGLALAGEEPCDLLMTFATLTGAARVALGPDLPAMFSTDDDLADEFVAAGLEVNDPVWRLPLWPGYEQQVDGNVSDVQNISDSPLGGAIFAALFLKRFVSQAKAYAHFDMFGWRQAAKPLGPAGGEPQCARAVLKVIEDMAAKAS